ncbi:DUF6192 family protein [Streptomyces canus]|uniref:DUF6192 family protein n=1 Tax=Streptomyces canus TaxID=58343 RepID=UPI003D9A7338
MAAGGAGTDLSWPSTRHGPFGTSSCGPWCHGLERLSNGFVGTSGGRRSRARRRFAHGAGRWTPDGAKRLVGQRVGQPGRWMRRARPLQTRPETTSATDLLKPSAVTEHVITDKGCEVVTELSRGHTVAPRVTTDCCAARAHPDGHAGRHRHDVRQPRAFRQLRPGPQWIRHPGRPRERAHRLGPDMASSPRSAAWSRRCAGQEFTDERETVMRQMGWVRAAADRRSGTARRGARRRRVHPG